MFSGAYFSRSEANLLAVIIEKKTKVVKIYPFIRSTNHGKENNI